MGHDEIDYRVDDKGDCNYYGSAEVWCCDDNYTYETSKVVPSETMKEYETAIAAFMENPLSYCRASLGGGGGLKRRSGISSDVSSQIRSTNLFSTIPSIMGEVEKLLYQIIAAPINGNPMVTAEGALWDKYIGPKYPNLTISMLNPFIGNDTRFKIDPRADLCQEIICNLDTFEDYVSLGPLTANHVDNTPDPDNKCDQWDPVRADPTFFDGDEDYTETLLPANSKAKRVALTLEDVLGPKEVAHFLEKRDGKPRPYNVNLGFDADGNPTIIVIMSWSYPSGDNGQALIDANGENVRYFLAEPDNCGTAQYYENEDSTLVPSWVVEHVFELQTVSRILGYLVSGTLPAVDTGGVSIPAFTSTFPKVSSWIFTHYFQLAYENWPNADTTPYTGRPDVNMMRELGAKQNANVLALMDAVGNNYKASVWALKSPIAEDRWTANGWNNADPKKGFEALSAIRGVLGVFGYLERPGIARKLHTVLTGTRAQWNIFEYEININIQMTGGIQLNSLRLWDECLQKMGERIDLFLRSWVKVHISRLGDLWQVIRDSNAQGTVLNKAGTNIVNALMDLLLELSEYQSISLVV